MHRRNNYQKNQQTNRRSSRQSNRQRQNAHKRPRRTDDEPPAVADAPSTPVVPIDIDELQIERVIARMAKIPEQSVSMSEKQQLHELEDQLQERLFGQEQAVKLVVDAIKRSRAGLRAPNKPIASLLFVGPTGVGKTELARQLATGLGIAMHRFDMSEFQEKHTVSRLIGSPPGYVGYDDGALLTDAIRQKPYAVLLLDEIEKAHPDIQSILLQLMDYATVTDNTGKQADFRNVILIMTSNAGARDIGKTLVGFGDNHRSTDAVDDAVKHFFSPEFRGRLDHVVLFNTLSPEIARMIVRKELALFNKQLAEKRVKLEATDECVALLAEEGFDEQAGARNIGRVVEQRIKSWFVDAILFGKLQEGGTATALVKEGKIAIRARKARRKRAG